MIRGPWAHLRDRFHKTPGDVILFPVIRVCVFSDSSVESMTGQTRTVIFLGVFYD